MSWGGFIPLEQRKKYKMNVSISHIFSKKGKGVQKENLEKDETCVPLIRTHQSEVVQNASLGRRHLTLRGVIEPRKKGL